MKISEALELVPATEREAIKEQLAVVISKIGAVDLPELVMLKTKEDAEKLIDGNAVLKPVYTSKKDSEVSTGVESFRKKYEKETVPQLVAAEVKKLNPDKDPKDEALEEMKKRMETLERENILKDQRILATKKAEELKIPLTLALTALGENDAETEKKVKALAETLNPWRQAAVDEFKKATFGTNPIPKKNEEVKPEDLETQYKEAEKNGNVSLMMSIKEQLAAQASKTA